MLAQRLLLDAKLIGDFGLCDAESRSPLDEGALILSIFVLKNGCIPCGEFIGGIMATTKVAIAPGAMLADSNEPARGRYR